MQNGKSPGNDGLTKEFYEAFWDDPKEIFVNSVRGTKEIGHLSTSQRQAIIKLIKKKRDKRFIKNWRPIFLLNVDSKIISKTLSVKLKEALPDLISSQQTAYVKHRNGKSISDIIEITKIRKIGGFLLTIDIEKAFNSLDYNFQISILEKYGFGQNFTYELRFY